VKLVVATKNEGKMCEIRAILADTNWEVVSMKDINIDVDVIEDKDTFEGNALKKAEEIMHICNEVTLADDSGLMVDALGNAPGVYSARYAGENATDNDNNLKLLKVMENEKNRSARFVCVLALAFPDGRRVTVRGEFEGEIGYEMKGECGFGYDVLFNLPEYKMTSAEIPSEIKNKISHRGKALQKLKELEVISLKDFAHVPIF